MVVLPPTERGDCQRKWLGVGEPRIVEEAIGKLGLEFWRECRAEDATV